MQCLNDETVSELTRGRLSPERLRSVEQHLVECSACRQLVAQVASLAGADATQAPDAVDPPTVDESHPRRPPPVGAAVGRYVLLRPVGEGGMGFVYAAYDPKLDRNVAVKFLRTGATNARTVSAGQMRLQREAQAMARLSHPNVVPVHDVGTFEDGIFIAMELVDGQTLSQWLHAGRRSWREVVRVFSQAGEGLAAAHRAGLVHRDFKPSNVFLDAEGRVRVGDFGLARALEGPEEVPGAKQSPLPSGPVLATPVTIAGTLIGTPGYMAPEQSAGFPASALTDQYAFCVSLCEALFGRRPLESPEPLSERNLPSSDEPVPGFLRKLVLRGLEPDPAKRFPSMDALLKELRNDPSRRRQYSFGAGLGVLLLAGAAGGARAYVHRQSQLCSGASLKLAGVWDKAVASSARLAIEKTRLPYAPATWTTVERRLDAYAAAFSDEFTDACEATRRRGEQSEQVLDLRMACLSDRLRDLRALTALLTKADAKVVENAVASVNGLPALAGCSDPASLSKAAPLPRDPALQVRIGATQDALAAAAALDAAGKYGDARTALDRLWPEVTAAGFAPLTARSYALLGRIDFNQHAEVAPIGLDAAARALDAAEQGGLDDVAIHALLLVAAGEVNVAGGAAQARVLASVAHGKIAHLPQQDMAAAQWHVTLAMLDQNERRIGTAVQHYRDALAIYEAHQDPLNAADALSGLAWLYVDAGQLDAAREALERALSLIEKEVGPEHPRLISVLNNLTRQAGDAGRFDLALGYLRRAMAISDRVFGAETVRHCFLSINLTTTLLKMGGHPDEALAEARSANALCAKVLSSDNALLANVPLVLGTALRAAGQPALALEVHQAVQADFMHRGTRDAMTCQAPQEMGADFLALGQPRQALASVRQALQCMSAASVEGLDLAEALQLLGEVDLALGDDAGAATALAKTVDIRTQAKGNPSDIAAAQVLWAKSRWKREPAAANALWERAGNVWKQLGKVDQVKEMEAWREKH